MLTAGAASLTRAVAPGGTLILSGITSEERETVYRAFSDAFSTAWSAEEDGWCCALLRAAHWTPCAAAQQPEAARQMRNELSA